MLVGFSSADYNSQCSLRSCWLWWTFVNLFVLYSQIIFYSIRNCAAVYTPNVLCLFVSTALHGCIYLPIFLTCHLLNLLFFSLYILFNSLPLLFIFLLIVSTTPFFLPLLWLLFHICSLLCFNLDIINVSKTFLVNNNDNVFTVALNKRWNNGKYYFRLDYNALSKFVLCTLHCNESLFLLTLQKSC